MSENTNPLTGLSDERLSEIWCSLNSWKVPEELMKHITDSRDHTQIWPFMEKIQKKIGIKKCLAMWNKLHPVD